MYKLFSLFILVSIFQQLAFAQSNNYQNCIFLSIDKPNANNMFPLDTYIFQWNKYDISTFNDPAFDHLTTNTNYTTLLKFNAQSEFNLHQNEYLEIWWRIKVDSSMAHKTIGVHFSSAKYTKVFWDQDIVINQGKLDVDQKYFEPNKLEVFTYPINTGSAGWHNLIIRQKVGNSFTYPISSSSFRLFYGIYRNYETYIAEKIEEEESFENIFLFEGYRFFLLAVFCVSVLFYLIVQKSKSFLWFSILSFSILLLLFLELIPKDISINSFPIRLGIILFILYSFLAFVFQIFIGEIPKRINKYFMLFIIITTYIAFNAVTHNKYGNSALYSFSKYIYVLLIVAIIIEIIIQLVFALITKRKRIVIIAIGVIQALILVPLSNFLPDNYSSNIATISFYILPISFLITLIYIIKDSFTENMIKQAEVLILTQTNERILREQNITLENQVKQRTSEVVKQKEEIEKQRQLSDDLLLNILPSEVAEELKQKGSAEAKQFDDVTVMFTDFKGFTQISEKLSPAELVAEIHTCFKAFDIIIMSHDIEKIKTIGDSYMCAGGLPVINKTNATDVVGAALEIQQYIRSHLEERVKEGKEPFDIRIGIHTGPVVAGIVGVKKFAYDIWGDTVNIASRMESSGEVGKINISGSTYELVKEKFNCFYRGKIPAKNKGEIDMYFVESIIKT